MHAGHVLNALWEGTRKGIFNMAAEVLSLLGKAGKRLAGWRLQELIYIQVWLILLEMLPKISRSCETLLVKLARQGYSVWYRVFV